MSAINKYILGWGRGAHSTVDNILASCPVPRVWFSAFPNFPLKIEKLKLLRLIVSALLRENTTQSLIAGQTHLLQATGKKIFCSFHMFIIDWPQKLNLSSRPKCTLGGIFHPKVENKFVPLLWVCKFPLLPQTTGWRPHHGRGGRQQAHPSSRHCA